MHSSEKPIRDMVAGIAGEKNRRLAWEFFVLFSRFEYALKRGGYLKNKEKAEADWSKFVIKHSDAFSRLTDQLTTDAVNYYLKNSPRKQLQKDEKMYWSEPLAKSDRETQLAFVCYAVKVVRNNLFHGGKFTQMPIDDPSRDKTLIGHAMEILLTLVELDIKVKTLFLEGLDVQVHFSD